MVSVDTVSYEVAARCLEAGASILNDISGLQQEPRLVRLAAAVVAGLLLCASFPPFDLWYLSFVALALLAWVLIDERTTPAGGFGYSMLAGTVFYALLLPWISNFVGPVPWLMLAALEAFFHEAAAALNRLRR